MEPCWLFLVSVGLDRAVCSLSFVYVNRRMGRVGHLNLAIESVPRLFRFVPSLLYGDDSWFSSIVWSLALVGVLVAIGAASFAAALLALISGRFLSGRFPFIVFWSSLLCSLRSCSNF